MDRILARVRRGAGGVRAPRRLRARERRRAKSCTASASTMSASTATSALLSGGWKMRVAMARVLLGAPDVLLMDEPTNHLDIESIIWLEAFLKSLTGRAADDVARSRVHEPRRRRRSPRSTAARSPSTRATTTSTSASARSARPTAKPPTRGSRRCWPRSSASSSGSRRTPPRPRRCRAASRRSRRSRRSSCRRSGSVVRVRLPAAAAVGRPGRRARGRVQGVRPIASSTTGST